MANHPIVAVELGTSRTRVLVGEDREGQLMVTGSDERPSSGMRKSDVVDFDNALTTLRGALHDTEEKCNISIHSVHLALSGGQVKADVHRGTIHIMNESNEIGPKEIEEVTQAARSINLPPERCHVHTLHQSFFVDDIPVNDPAGLTGHKIEEDALIVHAGRTQIENLTRVARTASVDVWDVAFSGLCAATAVLTPDQKQNGCLVIDLGGGTTTYFAYADRMIAAAGAFGIGGDHVTNDIAFGLGLPHAQAEKLKQRCGNAVMLPDCRGRTETLPSEGGFGGKVVRLVELHVVIHARMDELFRLIHAEMERSGLLSKIGAGIVLTGGGALMPGVGTLAESIFNQPCAIGKPSGLSGLTSLTHGPEFATIVGLLKYGHRSYREMMEDVSGPGQLLRNLMNRIRPGGRR